MIVLSAHLFFTGDTGESGATRYVYLVGSWIEHLRQQERHTMNDCLLLSRVLAFHQGSTPPAIRYLVAPV